LKDVGLQLKNAKIRIEWQKRIKHSRIIAGSIVGFWGGACNGD